VPFLLKSLLLSSHKLLLLLSVVIELTLGFTFKLILVNSYLLSKLAGVALLFRLNFVFQLSKLLFKVPLFGLLLLGEFSLQLILNLAFFLLQLSSVFSPNVIYFLLVLRVY